MTYCVKMMALQEHSLYDDRSSVYNKSSTDSSMYLDLKRHKPHVLNTPDVSVFALSTPEVHNLLSSTTGTSVTSTVPPHHSPAAGRFHPPPAVTMEQEFYARGFLERLEALQANDIHQQHSTTGHHHSNKNNQSLVHFTGGSTSSYHPTALGSNPSLEAVAPTYVTATLDHIPNFAATTTQTTSESTSSFPVSSQHDIYYSAEPYSLPYPRHEATMIPPYPTAAMLTAASTIAQPTMYGVMETTGPHDVLKEMTMVPDLQTQEQMKVERKKARNRIAASKCRTRRLQRESDLESKVKILKDTNKELNDEVSGLKEQIMNLKRALSQHAKTGCQINTTMNLSPVQ